MKRGLQQLPCVWSRPARFVLQAKRHEPRPHHFRRGQRRILLLVGVSGETSEPLLPVKRWAFAASSWLRRKQALETESSTHPLPSRRLSVPRQATARTETANRGSVIAISIISARTLSKMRICPGGQQPDWLRARPSDEVKFSVSSPRSRNSTAPRSRPRHLDL